MRLFRTCVFIVAVPLLLSSARVMAQAPSADEWAAMGARIERAVAQGAAADLRAIHSDLLRRLAPPVDAAREGALRYTAAYAAWRLATVPAVSKEERGDLLDGAVSQLQQAVKRDPKDAESHALLGSVYGLQIAESPMTGGMRLGPRASAALDRAASLEPGNPRVLLLQGVSAFNTPAMFGGGSGKAETLLRRSLERFAAEPIAKAWPAWGRFDAHVWLGQTLAGKGHRAAAKAEYDKALAITPNSGWVKHVLLPALDAKK
jgi:tetratricopeptide (TPR) repeat protein